MIVDFLDEAVGPSLQFYRHLAQLGLLPFYVRTACLDATLAAVDLSEQEARQARLRFAQEVQLADEAAVARYARVQMLTPEALDRQMLRPARQRKFCQREFGAKAEARFLQRKTQLDRVVYSLLRLRDAGLARELYLRIDAAEANFADLAAQYAEGPEKATRGIVGPVPLAQAHPLLADRLRTAPPGVVLEPFRIESWWLVVRLESLTSATFDEAMATRMTQELFEQWLADQVEHRLEGLRDQVLGPS